MAHKTNSTKHASVAEAPPKHLYESGVPKASGAVTIGTVRKGLSIDVFKAVATELEMTDREFARALGIPSRTFDRRLTQGALTPEESDRLARVAKILKQAREVFSSPAKARGWINTPLAVFDGETPLQRMDTSLGATQVEDVLGRIDEGVYS
ncbi:MAG TPA: antitoxin Xre/MbcA/ParS toxin-binding domain-containing protein [Chthoniobacterales bacterium]|jgi:putative toxin-antitoxin system antitoxin component (TIGR02293 family)|nr:antitoxin Xre/MbcA/ParS toxin-binding domain-containing protein [Chthoniobacterales bacterium]